MRFVLFFIVYLLCVFTHAQEQHFVRHPAFLNLPTNECYNITQDVRGYIWVGTDKGLFRFNGDSLKRIQNPRGAGYKPCYNVKQDKENGLFILGNSNFLYYYNYKTGRTDTTILTSNLAKIIDNPFLQSYSLTPIDDSLILINTQYTTYKANIKSYKVTRLKSFDTLADFNFVIENNQCYQVKKYPDKNKSRKFKPGDSLSISVKRCGKIRKIKIKFNESIYPSWASVCLLDRSGNFYISLSASLFKITPLNKVEQYTFPAGSLTIHIDKENDLWVGSAGVFYFKNCNLKSVPIRSLSKTLVSTIFVDYEKNIWCTTLRDGVFMCRKKQLIYYPNSTNLNKVVGFLKQQEGILYASSEPNSLTLIKGTHVCEMTINGISGPIKTIQKEGAFYYISADKLYRSDTLFHELKIIYTSKNSMASAPIRIHPFGKDTLLCFTRYTAFLIVHDIAYEWFDFKNSLLSTRINKSNDLIIYSDKENIYRISRKGPIPLLQRPMNTLNPCFGPDGSLWFNSTEDSIYQLKNGDLINFSKKYNFLENDFTDLEIDPNGDVWISSIGKLFKLSIKNNNLIKTNYSFKDGLISKSIVGLYSFDSCIYPNTEQGVFVLPINQQKINVFPKFYINSVFVQSNAYKMNKNIIESTYEKNTLRLNFDVLTFMNILEKPTLTYQIPELDNRWEISKGPFIELTNLPVGNYTLNVRAINAYGILSNKMLKFKIFILGPFWHSWWFRIGLLLLFFLFIYLIFKWRIKRVKYRESEKVKAQMRLLESEMKALRAQMNPHFIFNAMNSIQHFILTNDNDSAQKYLLKFSKLIRSVLENSKTDLVTLQEELDTLKMYLEIEALRFADKIQYSIIIGEYIDLDNVFIPPMILQPYIENAIWHGLLPKEGIKTLTIELKKVKDSLLCIIDDNGVGRKVAFASHDRPLNKKSLGMEITSERLEILNYIYKTGILVQVMDKTDDFNHSLGTRIELRMPLIKK
jgi:hypothetical protein